MSLKDDIEMVLEDAYWIGSDAAKGRREVEPSMLQARDKADRILEIVREAMLSEEAVEAANSVSVTFHDGEGAVTAALAAAGLTGGQGNE